MYINPNLTGAQNIIAVATDPAFTAPTNPNDIGVGAPLPYPPPSGLPIAGVNVDGVNSNTMVAVYIRDLLEDANEDGATQVVLYERISIATTLHPHVSMPSGLGAIEALDVIAVSLGLALDQIQFVGAYLPGQADYVIQNVTNSLLYLSSTLTVTINYTD